VKIGISASFFHKDPKRALFKGKTLLYIEESLSHWIHSSGALAYMIPTGSARDLMTGMDGLVLSGGADLSPKSYGERPFKPEWEGDFTRDQYELELLKAAMDLRKPVLGVCRGIQLINVAMGGTLYQDITSQNEQAIIHRDWEVYDQLFHDVRFEPNSWIEKWLNVSGGRVNTVHHQGVKDLGKNLVVEAKSLKDGIIEALRYESPDGVNEHFVYGIQWHPEWVAPEEAKLLDSPVILDSFLKEVKARC